MCCCSDPAVQEYWKTLTKESCWYGCLIKVHIMQFMFSTAHFYSDRQQIDRHRPKEIGCFLSHLSAMTYFDRHLEQGKGYVALFEDDAACQHGTNARIHKLLPTIPPDWYVVAEQSIYREYVSTICHK